MLKTTALLALTFVASITASAANLVANSGFETGDFTSWTLGGPAVSMYGGAQPDPVTTTPADGNQYVGVGAPYGPGVYPSHSGNYYAYFGAGGFTTGGAAMTEYYTLTQNIATTIGQAYTISFYVANDTTPDTTHGYYNEVLASFGAGSLIEKNIAGTTDASTYTEYTFYGLATSTSTTLSFSFDNEAGLFDFDDVSIMSGTPEPATLLLAVPAFGALFLVRRRRARTNP